MAVEVQAPAPFAPSPLANALTPPTPTSLPITTQRRPSLLPHIPTHIASAAPPHPLPWLWQCHLCHRTYALGVTRRCLDDGHFFCAGQTPTTTRRAKKRGSKRIGKACASEFDYAGWSALGVWKRVVAATSTQRPSALGRVQRKPLRRMETRTSPGARSSFDAMDIDMKPEPQVGKKDCFLNCDYPSECRWGREAQIERENDEREQREELRNESMRDWVRRQHNDSDSGFGTPATTFEEILGLPELDPADEEYLEDLSGSDDESTESSDEEREWNEHVRQLPRLERVRSRGTPVVLRGHGHEHSLNGFGCDVGCQEGVFAIEEEH